MSRGNGSWSVQTGKGEIDARQVVLATGYENEPLIPDWDGRESFAGELIHSADYRNAERFKSRRVLVAAPRSLGHGDRPRRRDGRGSEGLAGGANTADDHLSCRPRRLAGRVDRHGVDYFEPVRGTLARFGSRQDFGDLSPYGLPVPEAGLMTRFWRDGTVPSIVDKEVIEAVKQGTVEVVGAVESLDSAGSSSTAEAVLSPTRSSARPVSAEPSSRWSATSVS